MSKSLKYFDIDLPINDKREIRGITLNNGINVVLISDHESNTSSCSVGINGGYLQDTFEGTAHFLEHLLFMGSAKFPEQNTYHSYVQISGGIDNAFTGDNTTCYFLELESEFLEKGIEMLSWFFREPLLDMQHINSEREIINSEHQKNILSDIWIMDDIFKKFIIKSKYSNFGTGNSESLKDITKEDIMKFYDRYYTTDNLYVCIVDTLDIKTMISKYLKHFEDIPEKKYVNDIERFTKDNIKTITENLIVFNSVSQYNFLNFYIIVNCNEKNQHEYQTVNLISSIIGSEYVNSLSYFLKENNIANYVKTNVDYYYDYEAIIGINISLIDNNKDNFNKICVYINSLLNKMSEIDENEFKNIYNNYRKINLLQTLYGNRGSSSDISNDIVDNLIKGEKCLCVIRKNFVSEYNYDSYNIYKKILEDIELKITTNINIENKNDGDFLESEFYKTKYYISDYNFKMKNANMDYKFENLITFSNIPIKTENTKSSVNKKELPRLIFKNDIREIYLLEHNKYEKPMMNISVIRKNNKFVDKKHNLIILIYKNLCLRILNYYLDTISNYKMYFSFNVVDEYLILNFNGLDYVMKKFINDIINKISFYSIQANVFSKRYFEEIIRDIKENLLNLKYNSPYQLCLKYFSIILSKDFMPDEAIKYIDNLSYDSFIEQLDKLLIFEKEYFIIVGNIKNCADTFLCEDSVISSAMDYIDLLSLSSLRYEASKKEDVQTLKFDEDKIYQEFNYKLTKTQINPKEINNCLIDCYLVKKYNLNLVNDIIDKTQLMEIFRDKLIFGIISDLINEPLFNKIRTIDKLGYIVKSSLKYHTYENRALLFICYIIQSNHKIEDIYESINIFNEKFYKNFLDDKDNFEKMFESLKKSKILELQKNPNDLEDESSIYLSSIVNKYGIFNYVDLNLQILENIKFADLEEQLQNVFDYIVKNNRYYVILDKDK